MCGLGAAGITPSGPSQPCLSLSLNRLSLDPAEARTAWGVSAQGHGAERRGSQGRRQIPSWKSGTGIFCLSRHLWPFDRSVAHSFLHSFWEAVRQPLSTEAQDEPRTEGGRCRVCAEGSVGPEELASLLPGEGETAGCFPEEKTALFCEGFSKDEEEATGRRGGLFQRERWAFLFVKVLGDQIKGLEECMGLPLDPKLAKQVCSLQ